MTGRGSPSSHTVFFQDLKTWSEIKLRILTKYSDAYQRIRGSTSGKLYYVDGFAGAGWYGDQVSEGKEGSPVRLAKLAQQIADSSKAYRLICLNCEVDHQIFSRLQHALAGFDKEIVHNYSGSFESHLPDILKEIGRWPAVFFLDPFGPSPINLVNLHPILNRPDTELLLNLNTPSLRRIAGFADSQSNQRNAKLRIVSQVLGDDPADPKPEWLDTWHRIAPIEWEKWAAATYIKRLQARSDHLRYALAYPIRETFRSNPKYYLVFATRSFKAIPIMNDLICTEEDDLFLRTEAVKKGQATFFGRLQDLEFDSQIESLPEQVHEYGLAHPGCTRPDIIRHFLLERFGQFKVKHYRQAIAKLVVVGRAQFSNARPNDKDPINFT